MGAAIALAAAAFALGRFTAPYSTESASDADFVFTDEMVANLESYEEVVLGPTGLSLCIGESMTIANASSATVGLTDTPDESDNRIHLGIVKPGGMLTVTATHRGTNFIGVVGRKGALVSYVVDQC